VTVGDRPPLRDQRDVLDLLSRREALQVAALEGDQVQLAQRREAEQCEEAGKEQANPPLDQLCGPQSPCRPRACQGVAAPVVACW
jgi:hypothetical protein